MFKVLIPKMRKMSWVILIGFTTLFILDIISTYSVGDLVKYMETNPVYHVTGMWGVIVLNIISVWILLKAYGSDQVIARFNSLSAFIWLSAIRTFVVINNFKLGKAVQEGVITEAMVQGVATSVKVTHYFTLVGLSVIIPFLLTAIIFGLFVLDHIVESKE